MYSESPSEKQEKSKDTTASLKEEMQRRKAQIKYLNAVIAVAANWLSNKPEAAPALSYLNKRVDPKDHHVFKFGYFPNDLASIYNFMDDLHTALPRVDPKVALEETGIVEFRPRKNKIFYYNNPLLIPYFDVYGNPVSIVGRTLLPEKEMKEKGVVKYKNLPFHRSQHLFGLNLSRFNMVKRDFGIIIEGQFDMISTYLGGLDNVAALCGSKIGMEHVLLLKRYTKNLGILLDNDEAGEKGWKAVQSKSSKYELTLQRLMLPTEYNDVDQFVRSGGSVDYFLRQFHSAKH